MRLPLSQYRFASSVRRDQLTEAELALQSARTLARDRLSVARTYLRLAIDEQAGLRQLIEQIQAQIQDRVRAGATRLVLVLRREKLALERQHAGLYLRALRDYVDYLDEMGRLAEAPLRSWLQTGTPIL